MGKLGFREKIDGINEEDKPRKRQAHEDNRHMKKAKGTKLLTVVVLLALAVAVTASVFWWRKTLDARRKESKSAMVTASPRDFTSSVLATGAVRPQVGAEVHVGARISGKVTRLKANIGDMVKKGQVIAELEKEDLEAMVAQRQAELDLTGAKLSALEALRPKEVPKAQAEVDQWEATVALSQKELERQDRLLKQNSTTRQAWDRTRERLSVAEAQLLSAQKKLEVLITRYDQDLKQARMEVARARASLDQASVQLSYATIVAPISGAIASVSTQEGETVAAGFSAPTFVTIIDLDRLQVDAYVDEVDIGKVKPGQKAIFTVDTFPNQEFEGRVNAIYPKAVIQENVVNYDVVIEITGPPAGLLRPEMTASVTVFLDQRKDVLALPVKAVGRERGKNVVYVPDKDGQPRQQEIKVGWKDGQWIEIVSGLSEQEPVLLDLPKPDNRTE